MKKSLIARLSGGLLAAALGCLTVTATVVLP